MRVIFSRISFEFIFHNTKDEFFLEFYKYKNFLISYNNFSEDSLSKTDSAPFSERIKSLIRFIPGSEIQLSLLDLPAEGECIWIIPSFLKSDNPAAVQNADRREWAEKLASSSWIVFSTGEIVKPDILLETGSDRIRTFPKLSSQNAEMDHRTLLWLGENNYNIINNSEICCIGSGGVMNPFVIQAVHHGFRKFTLIDSDTLDETNRNRFAGSCESDVGRFKTDILKDYILSQRKDAEVLCIHENFPNENGLEALLKSDIIISGVDNDYARVILNLFCLSANRAFFDMGSGIYLKENSSSPEVDEAGGQIRFLSPDGPCLVCMGKDLSAVKNPIQSEFERNTGYLAGTDLTPPSVITVNFSVSSLCLSMAAEYILNGKAADNHIRYDSVRKNILKIREEEKADCPFCGNSATQ